MIMRGLPKCQQRKIDINEKCNNRFVLNTLVILNISAKLYEWHIG